MNTPAGITLCMGRTLMHLAPRPSRAEDRRPVLEPLGEGFGPVGDTALWLARQGCPTRVLTRLGGDVLGDSLRERLRGEGVDTAFLERCPEEATGLAVHGERCVEYPGADRTLPATATERETFEGVRCCHVPLSTFAIGPTRAGWQRALDLAREEGARVAVHADFHPLEGWTRYQAQAVITEELDPIDLLWASETEIRELFPGFWNLDALLEGLEEMGAVRVVLLREDGDVLTAGPGSEPDAVGRIPMGDVRAATTLEALVLARWVRGHELVPALESACHLLPELLSSSRAGAPNTPGPRID